MDWWVSCKEKESNWSFCTDNLWADRHTLTHTLLLLVAWGCHFCHDNTKADGKTKRASIAAAVVAVTAAAAFNAAAAAFTLLPLLSLYYCHCHCTTNEGAASTTFAPADLGMLEWSDYVPDVFLCIFHLEYVKHINHGKC